MAIFQLILSYLQVLIWPLVVTLALIMYRSVIETLASPSEVTFTFFGVSIKIPLKTLVRSLEDNMLDTITDEQWGWLKRLHGGRADYDSKTDYQTLLPLRNAGLIRAYPERVSSQSCGVGMGRRSRRW